MRSSGVGLLFAAILLVGSLHEGDSQFFPAVFDNLIRHPQQRSISEPPGASVTTADSEAYSRDVQLGKLLGLNGGITRSQSLTQNENGATNAEKSTSLTKGVKIGQLDLSSTVTGTKTVENGKVSRELSKNVNIGDLGIDSSLSKDNLKNGIGIRRSDNGGLDLDLGLLNVDLSKGKKQPATTGTNVDIQAVGDGANANTISNTDTQTNTLGKLSTTSIHSKSSGIGSVLNGLTGGSARGVAGGAPSGAVSGLFRVRRQIDFVFPDQFGPGGGYRPQGHRRQPPPPPPPPRKHHRQPQINFPGFQQGGLANSNANANANSQVLQGNQGFPGSHVGPGGQVLPGGGPAINNNANAQGQAASQNAGFQQDAGANTNTQNIVNDQGQFLGNTGSSIASNLANDGSSGQVSSANTAQQAFNTADGSGNKNAAQSQSLNFDKNNLQATSSNADTSHTKTATGERDEANSGATVNQQSQFGTSSNVAQTHTATSNENGLQSTQSNANSQSIFQGADGGVSNSNTGATAGTVQGPNGLVTNTASSQAASFSNNGGPASASASSSSGTGPNGSFANSQGFTNGAASNAFTGLRRQQSFAGGQANAFGPEKWRSKRDAEPRTFDTILSLVQGLFETDCNQCSPYMVSTNQNNCCTKCCSPCCPQCCYYPPNITVTRPPLPPPRPPLPPPPPPPPPRPPQVQITSAIFTPWYYPTARPCCSTCPPQIGAFPCGYGGGGGRPYFPPYNYYG